MEPYAEHAFYAWVIILGAVFLTAFVGALIWRVRFMKANHEALIERRRNACDAILRKHS